MRLSGSIGFKGGSRHKTQYDERFLFFIRHLSNCFTLHCNASTLLMFSLIFKQLLSFFLLFFFTLECPEWDNVGCRYYQDDSEYYCKFKWTKIECPNMCGLCESKLIILFFIYILYEIFMQLSYHKLSSSLLVHNQLSSWYLKG